MNELNPWEKQLQSWTPRRPSAKLEQRLFSGAAESPSRRSIRPPAWIWLAPATCLLLLAACVNVTRHGETIQVFDVGGSNMLASVSTGDSRCQEWNVWEAVTFDWTKGGASLSTTGSFPVMKNLWNTNVQKL